MIYESFLVISLMLVSYHRKHFTSISKNSITKNISWQWLLCCCHLWKSNLGVLIRPLPVTLESLAMSLLAMKGTIEEAGKYNHMRDWQIQEVHAHKERWSFYLSFPRIFPIDSSDGVKFTKLFQNKALFQFKYRNTDRGET